jgi:hypothetical protein
MRATLLLGGIAGLLALTAKTWAQAPAPYNFETRTITLPEVEVRSGPSVNDVYYPTSVLKRGDPVQVIINKRDVPPGWLAIKPPPGSFSWVNAQHVTQLNSFTGTIHTTDAPVLVGSRLTGKPPSVKSAQLERGSQVVILDKPLVASDGSRWLPIEPFHTEVRFIPENAIGPNPGAQAVAAKPPVEAGPAPAGPAPASVQHAAAAGPAAGAVALTGQVNPAPATSLYGTGNPPATAATNATPGGANGPTPTPTPVEAEHWIGPGLLFKANVPIDGQQAYRLEDYRTKAFYYVIAKQGLNLDQYVNRYVYLYGPSYYCGEAIRVPYVAARAAQVWNR